MKNTTSLTTMQRKETVKKFAIAAAIAMGFAALTLAPGMMAFAVDGKVNAIVAEVIKLITSVAKAAGLIIALWGAFQCIMAFRREDSEGISKQITTIIVGAILAGFGLLAPVLQGILKG